jgi:hypothetical protein
LEKETLLWRGDHFKLKVGVNRYAEESSINYLRDYFSCNTYGRITYSKGRVVDEK